MIKCNSCPRKASCTIEPSACCVPTNYTITLPKVKTENEINQEIREKTIREVYNIVTDQMIKYGTDLDFNIETQNKILDLLYRS